MTKNHSEAQAGSIHAPFRSMTGALIESQWSLVIGSGDTIDAGKILVNDSPETWHNFLNGTSYEEGTDCPIDVGGLVYEQSDPWVMVSNGNMLLPQASFGYGRFIVSSASAGTAAEWLAITWDSTGVPYEVAKSANALLSDTAGYFCAFRYSTYCVIRNRLGSTKNLVFELHYKPLQGV